MGRTVGSLHSDGAALRAGQDADYGLAMFGTRSIAAEEAATSPQWQAALERVTARSIIEQLLSR